MPIARVTWTGIVLASILLAPLGCGRGALRDATPPVLLGKPSSGVDLAGLDRPIGSSQLAAAQVQEPLSGPHSVDFYVQYADANNQAIRAAIHEVNAARDRVPQARSLDDPMLMAQGYPFFPNTPQTAAGRATGGVEVSQKVPWFGKRRLQAEIACDELRIAEAQLAAARLEVAEQVRRAYYELYYLQRGILITQQNRKVLEQIAKVADVKYQVNQVSQQDLLRAQVELSNLDIELVRLRQQLVSNQARLARLLHVSPDANLQAEDSIDESTMALELERLYEVAIQTRPELQAELHAIRREQSATQLARKQFFPDTTIGINWMEMTTHKALAPTADGVDDVGLSLTVNLPIYYKRLHAAVREGESRTLAAAGRYDSQRDQTLETVKDLFTQVQSQRELIQLFAQSILPKAQQALDVSLTGYEAGQVDFLQLLSNFQEILKVQLMLERQRSQLQQTLASLDRAIGGSLNQHVPHP